MSELFPAKNIALEYVECTDVSKEWDFNYWYNRTQIPDVLKTPGIVNAYRYRSLGVVRETGHLHLKTARKEGESTYLTIYRINSDDPWSVMEQMQQDRKQLASQGRIIDIFQSRLITVWSFLAYRRSVQPMPRPEIHLSDGMPEALIVVPTLCNNEARRAEANDWYFNTHFHDLLETPGMIQAHRYSAINPKPEKDDAEYLALYEIEADDPAAVMKFIVKADAEVRAKQGRLVDFIVPPYGFEIYQHFDI